MAISEGFGGGGGRKKPLTLFKQNLSANKCEKRRASVRISALKSLENLISSDFLPFFMFKTSSVEPGDFIFGTILENSL